MKGSPLPGKPHILLITGAPGTGKTTLIKHVAKELADRHPGGFYTEEIREKGERQGFRIVTFNGQKRIIAHVDFPKTHRVGKYGVNVAAMDEIAGSALAPDPAVSLYLIDEIGKMECLSARFVGAMKALLDSGQLVVATVGQRGAGFMSEVKRRKDALLWELTRANREDLPKKILEWLEAQ